VRKLHGIRFTVHEADNIRKFRRKRCVRARQLYAL
jgi:hypothetical protein